VSFNVSIPLGRMPVAATYTGSHDRDRGYNQQTGIYGTAFDDARLTYAAQVGHNRLDGVTSSGSMAYAGSMGILSLGRSQGRAYGQTNIGLAGAAVLHSHGLTLSQPLGETIAIVHAPGARNVGIEGYNGVRTDYAGNAIVPSMSPYRINRLALRTGQLGEEVEVKNAAVEVVPTRGAVVMANFETRIGHRVMLNLTDSQGTPIPLGAMLFDGEDREVGMVGTDGQAFATGLDSAGTLTAKWGADAGQSCSVSYQIDAPPADQKQAAGQVPAESVYRELDLQCSGVSEFTASDDSKPNSLQ
jgi:outer membrane usher protein